MEKLTEQGYNDLIHKLLESQNLDKDLKVSHQDYFLQNGHWVYYQMLFRTIEKIRIAASLEKDREKLDGLALLESKLYDHTNIIPTDLPDWIVNDRHLINTYFTDHSKVSTSKESWSAFQQHIQDKLEEIPKEMKIPFLEWCDRMLRLNLKNHNKSCTNQLNCGTNLGYERQLHFISKMIKEVTNDQAEGMITAVNQPKEMGKQPLKIEWLGTQRQLAELFAVLKKKGWIEKFEYDTIKACFTESNSIQQYLKPGKNKDSGEETYPEIFKPGYDERFYAIKKKSDK